MDEKLVTEKIIPPIERIFSRAETAQISLLAFNILGTKNLLPSILNVPGLVDATETVRTTYAKAILILFAAHNKELVPINVLGDALGVEEKATASTYAKRLVENGHATLQNNPNDLRQTLVELTDSAAAAVHNDMSHFFRTMSHLTQLPPDNLADLK